MCRLGSIAVFLAVFTVVPLAAQDEGPHVYVVTYIKAKPDRAAEYSRYWNEILGPLYDEFVKHEDMVSYHMLGQWPGIGPYSHVLIIEWVNWDTCLAERRGGRQKRLLREKVRPMKCSPVILSLQLEQSSVLIGRKLPR